MLRIPQLSERNPGLILDLPSPKNTEAKLARKHAGEEMGRSSMSFHDHQCWSDTLRIYRRKTQTASECVAGSSSQLLFHPNGLVLTRLSPESESRQTASARAPSSGWVTVSAGHHFWAMNTDRHEGRRGGGRQNCEGGVGDRAVRRLTVLSF